MEHQMFTIKHVHTNGGISLYQATAVNMRPYQPTSAWMEADPESIIFTTPDGVEGTIASGIVYIMNSSGKTIQTFNFNFPKDENVPVDPSP